MIFFIIFLGTLQGATEFLPISSSGHLAFFQNLPFFQQYSSVLAKEMPLLAFNIILHLGTLLAVIVYWHRSLLDIIVEIWRDLKGKNFTGPGFKKLLVLFLALLPAATVPFYKDHVEAVSGSLTALAVLFIINGCFLILTDFIALRKKAITQTEDDYTNLAWYKAVLIGIGQIIAVFPGISRSGSTISTGLLLGVKTDEAVRFSFLISIPIMIAAALLEAREVAEQGFSLGGATEYIVVGLISAFISGLLSLKLLVWLAQKLVFYPFGIYTILLGVITLLFLR